MTCFSIGKQKYADSTKLAEPTEAGKFEAVAITFKMDAKKDDRNEREPILSCFLSVFSLAQPRQRRQHSDHKRVQRQRQNTTITL